MKFLIYLFCFRTVLETQHSSTRTGHKNAMVSGWSPGGSWSLWGTSMLWTPSRTSDVKSPPSAWLPDVTHSPSKLRWSWEPLPRFDEAETSQQQLPGERVGYYLGFNLGKTNLTRVKCQPWSVGILGSYCSLLGGWHWVTLWISCVNATDFSFNVTNSVKSRTMKERSRRLAY